MNIDPGFTVNVPPFVLHIGPAAAIPHKTAALWICSTQKDPGWVKVPSHWISDFIDALGSGLPSFERHDNAARLYMQRIGSGLQIDTEYPRRTESIRIDRRVESELRDKLRAMKAWW